MSKNSMEKLGITIEKINYLYKTIQKRKGKSKKLELRLLKQYATELYDHALVFEASMKSSPSAFKASTTFVESGNDEILALQKTPNSPIVVTQIAGTTQETTSSNALENKDKNVNVDVGVKVAADNNQQTTDEIVEVPVQQVKGRLNMEPRPPISAPPITLEEAADEAFDGDIEVPRTPISPPNMDLKTENAGDLVKDKGEQSSVDLIAQFHQIKGKSITKVEDLSQLIQEQFEDVEDDIEESITTSETVLEETKDEPVEATQVPDNEEVIAETPSPKKSSTKDLEGTPSEHIATNPSEVDEAKNDPDETVRMELHDVLAKNKSKKITIADQLKNKPQASKTGQHNFNLSFNERFAYVKELFDGNAQDFDKVMSELSQSQGYIEALTYINLNVKHKYKWDEKSQTVKQFMKLIKVKFLG